MTNFDFHLVMIITQTVAHVTVEFPVSESPNYLDEDSLKHPGEPTIEPSKL